MLQSIRVAFLVTLCAVSTAFAAPIVFQESFDGASVDERVQIKGAAEVVSSQKHGGSGALQLSPGSQVTIKLSDKEYVGRIEMWVYDDMKTPKDTSQRITGPRWGLSQTNGRALVVGSIYAPYLDGDKRYSAVYFDGSSWFGGISRLGDTERGKGWHRWEFRMDNRRGLVISCDGKDVNARRKAFDWDKTDFTGITGLVFYGGQTQNVWIDDIKVALTAESRARPEAHQDMVPKKDPIERNVPELTDLMKNNVHPRLLLTKEKVAMLRRYAQGPGKKWMDKLNSYVGASTPPKDISAFKFTRDATDGQRHGFWRIPTVALHYLLTDDPRSLQNTIDYLKLLNQMPHWETSAEFDSGMSSANVCIGAGLAYDWVYDKLDPEFREEFREKLIYQARAQYYGGHLKRAPNRVHYWQGDPQNNHRWHRNAGMTSCLLAAYDGSEELNWMLARVHEELDYIAKWLPDDGTCHESNSYMAFGGSHLTVGLQASDMCFGTDYMNLPFFVNQASFRMQLMNPGMKHSFEFGDSSGTGSYNAYLFKGAIDAGRKDLYAGLLELADRLPNAFSWGWQCLVWSIPPMAPGNYSDMPLSSYWPDMGIGIVRDGWEKENVAAFFKCGPYGGFKLNELRNEDNYRYVNVAHDDPDANMFQLSVGGNLLAETDRYSEHKYTRHFNTILVNGSGQIQEADGFLQPTNSKGPYADMTKLSYVTGLLDSDDVYIIEGEASGAYVEIKNGQKWARKQAAPRPALERYRRSMIWVKGKYVLVLDDIEAASNAEFTWMIQAPELKELGNGRYELIRPEEGGDVSRDFQLVCDDNMRTKIVDSGADHRGKPLGHRQLRAEVRNKRCRFASVYNIWQVDGLSVSIKPVSKNMAEVTVTGDGINDTWTWDRADNNNTPSSIKATLGGGTRVDFGRDDVASHE